MLIRFEFYVDGPQDEPESYYATAPVFDAFNNILRGNQDFSSDDGAAPIYLGEDCPFECYVSVYMSDVTDRNACAEDIKRCLNEMFNIINKQNDR